MPSILTVRPSDYLLSWLDDSAPKCQHGKRDDASWPQHVMRTIDDTTRDIAAAEHGASACENADARYLAESSRRYFDDLE